jgi:hypothetical protein
MLVLVIGLFISFMVATAVTAFIPQLCELASPLLCPSGSRTETSSKKSVSQNYRGGRPRNTTLFLSYCVSNSDTGVVEKEMNPITARLVLFAYGAAVSVVAQLIVAFRSRSRINEIIDRMTD